MKTILFTGVNSFIGSYIYDKFKNDKQFNLLTTNHIDIDNFTYDSNIDFIFHIGNICDNDSFEQLQEKVLIYNVTYTSKIINLAKKYNTHLTYFSSIGALYYQDYPQQFYNEGKRIDEYNIQRYLEKYTILRLTRIYDRRFTKMSGTLSKYVHGLLKLDDELELELMWLEDFYELFLELYDNQGVFNLRGFTYKLKELRCIYDSSI